MGTHVKVMAVALLAIGLQMGNATQAQAEERAGAATEQTTTSERFGDARQWTFSSDAALSIQRRTQNGVGGAVTTITLAPAADYFVVSRFSVGGFVGLDYTKTDDRHGTRFSFGPRVGFAFTLSKRWAVWPKLGISYAYTSTSARDSRQNAVALNVFAPFLFLPVDHFFAGFGPFVDTDLNGDNRATVWGGKLTIGGWL